MSIMQTILYNMPPSAVGFFVVGIIILLSVTGLLLVRKFIHFSKLKLHHDVAAPILGALAGIYSVLMAFVAVTVWQDFDKCNSNVEMEANYIGDVYRDAEAFSPEFRQKVGALLREYRAAVVKYEWEAMARGEMSPEAETLMRKIWSLYTSYEPRNLTEQAFFEESVRKLNLFREIRRQRIMDSRAGVNPLLWLVLLSGAVATISFTFLFGAENINSQIVMVVLLSAMIGIILFAIMELDYPFTGSVLLSPKPIEQLLLD